MGGLGLDERGLEGGGEVLAVDLRERRKGGERREEVGGFRVLVEGWRERRRRGSDAIFLLW